MNASVFQVADGPTTPKRTVIVHASESWFDHIASGKCDFFEKLGAAAQANGYGTQIIHSDDFLSMVLMAGPQAHIVVGPKAPSGRNILHAHPTYLRGFWYLDPKGYFWNSSVRDAVFDADTVDPIRAGKFCNRVRDYMVGRNISKRPQSPVAKVTPAKAVFFVQDIEKYKKRVDHLTTDQIIATLGRTVDGPFYVKLHPLLGPGKAKQITALCDATPNAMISDASVHDLIAASDVVVSQNSAVGFEALMHEKPVLTCGQCDYHHATLQCQSEADLADALSRAVDHFKDFPFAQYFYWFLGTKMFEPQKKGFEDRVMKVVQRAAR